MKDILERSTLRLPSGWKWLLAVFAALGVIAFVVGLASGNAERTWQAFLINTMFWGGMAQAGVMLSVIWQVTDAKWGRPFKRLAEGFGAFLPIAFVAFVMVALFGTKHLYDWMQHPMQTKVAYLNYGFFASRNIIGLVILFGVSFLFVKTSVMPDLALAQKLLPGWGGSFATSWLKHYDTSKHEAEVVRLERKSRILAPALGILYAVIISMVAFDYVMSLDQEWYSTLFGVYSFVGHLYSALTLLLIIVAITRKMPGLSEYMTLTRYGDLAKLTFAIAMLHTYMAFSQYLVIWYSNLPEESPFLVIRSIEATPWRPLFWTLFVVIFLFPFVGLLSRTVCRNPTVMTVFAAILWVGMWWANYLHIVPSVQRSHGGEYHFLFGLPEILLTVGFAGAFFLCFFAFMAKVPVIPVSDKHLCKSWHGH
jgi:hypothetical protein